MPDQNKTQSYGKKTEKAFLTPSIETEHQIQGQLNAGATANN